MAEKRRNSAFWYRLAMGLLFAIVVVYTAYHLFSLFFSDDISTIVSGVTTERVTVGGDGYVFRDETLLYSRNSGVVERRCPRDKLSLTSIRRATEARTEL